MTVSPIGSPDLAAKIRHNTEVLAWTVHQFPCLKAAVTSPAEAQSRLRALVADRMARAGTDRADAVAVVVNAARTVNPRLALMSAGI